MWYEGVAEVARRFQPRLVMLFAGSAKPRGPFHLTMDNNDAIETAHAFAQAKIVAIHNEGWGHFTESQADVIRGVRNTGFSRSFANLGKRSANADLALISVPALALQKQSKPGRLTYNLVERFGFRALAHRELAQAAGSGPGPLASRPAWAIPNDHTSWSFELTNENQSLR